MNGAERELFHRAGGIATARELRTVMTRPRLDWLVRRGEVLRVCHGVYADRVPDLRGRLRALDLYLRQEAVACLGTAASLYGFDVENTVGLHILDPGRRIRPTVGVSVHQRVGAPLHRVAGRAATAPAWTAVETARRLSRPRALATLDAAVHSTWCDTAELARAVDAQFGRRGIVAVRDLLPHVDGRAESAMESEARLVMIDYGLPTPVLQYEIHGRDGVVWRVDFAWPDERVVAEYESVEWHTGRDEMVRDRKRVAALQDLGWTVIPIVVDDVRHHPAQFAERIATHLSRRLAG
ncbi:type IV toxin-antitoxin system AbiEi family antitoxin domain-containing protein [Mycobacterium sp. GA-2829]|uniref:type IV toxin-antitoxin system AbiEi family antitoxin domain-containing protein n=1 Tax=Mycobacterium sp. GA-2829 TaxID=1772283 RepID=UPI0012FAA858|nr:type IV toxin-antitoxin system AbiEi family antitoxin domain-containing protein [Mycobacterium sp. GA-2829]